MESDPFHPHYRQRRLPGFSYADANHAFFLTIRAKAGTCPFTNQALAGEIITSLHWLRQHREITLHAYCLMPDHLHLLMRLGSRGETVGTIIGAFKRYTTRQSWKYGTNGALWQARFYDHILRHAEEAERIAQYIVHNPVRKGLVEEEHLYPFTGCPDPLR